MKLLLAPMEGLADDVLRQVLTRAGGYDWAVTEFAKRLGTDQRESERLRE